MMAAAVRPGVIVVAIDGPSGVGKSTAARALARRLGVPFLDTGAMYRAIGLKVLAAGADPDDRVRVVEIAGGADVRLEQRDDGAFQVLLDGAPVEPAIRTPEVGEATSAISAYPEVRRRLVALQREAAAHFGGVLEGRDIGTHVFPETPFKFYLDADPEVRFLRRHRELEGAGRPASYDQVVEEMTRRDHRDSHRPDSPLTCTPEHILLDASGLTSAEVVERMAEIVAAGAPPRAD
jgi:cytidylate kinase